jgi:hypothetical protein
VWYKFIAPITASVTFQTTGSNYDTSLSVWTGTAPANLVQLGCNDDGASAPTSSLTVNTTAAKTYYIRIAGDNGTSGNLILLGEILPPATIAPPRNFFTVSDPVLSWNRVTWATNYEIQIDDTATFIAPLTWSVIVPSSALSVQTSPLLRGQYYWRLRAQNASGVWGAWSTADSFLVDVP